MGFSSYSSVDRATRSVAAGYATKSVDEIFTQQKERRAHDSMNPINFDIREARDSEEHPNTVPIQLFLDVTGSMGVIPHELIKDGLPKLIGKLIQEGVPDVALMFGAIGDHECDRFPLQVAQFESGDEELDMWLTRTYLEGGGGGNYGESYPLAWYFAANRVVTDAFDKRGQKGIVITIGDEPFLNNYPATALQEVTPENTRGQVAKRRYTATDLYEAACKKNHVFHIHFDHGRRGPADEAWVDLLGQNLVTLEDYSDLPDTIVKLVLGTIREKVRKPATNHEAEAYTEPEVL